MTPRGMVIKRDEYIKQAVRELIIIQENIPQIIKEFNEWPIIMQGPTNQGAYGAIENILRESLERHTFNIMHCIKESAKLNLKIQEVIEKAYE